MILGYRQSIGAEAKVNLRQKNEIGTSETLCVFKKGQRERVNLRIRTKLDAEFRALAHEPLRELDDDEFDLPLTAPIANPA